MRLNYDLGDPQIGVLFPTRARYVSLIHNIRTGSGANTAFYPMRTSGSFRGLKRPKGEGGHSPISRAEIKNVWSYATNPAHLHGAVLNYAQGQRYH
jgi:hypothetical protein